MIAEEEGHTHIAPPIEELQQQIAGRQTRFIVVCRDDQTKAKKRGQNICTYNMPTTRMGRREANGKIKRKKSKPDHKTSSDLVD